MKQEPKFRQFTRTQQLLRKHRRPWVLRMVHRHCHQVWIEQRGREIAAMQDYGWDGCR